MLRMKPVGKGERGARRAELYFEKTDSGYYHAKEGLHCEWGGSLGARLGLEGKVPDYEHFKRLLRGCDPWTGEQLTARLRDDRIPAWDVTASIPKGATAAIERGDERILPAFRASYREAMAMVERYATTRVRVDGKQEDRLTQSLLYYAQEHPDTRPVENKELPKLHPWRIMPLPDYHAHLIVLNATWDPIEEKVKALKFRPIMDQRQYFDRCFDAIFARKLSDLGYEIETKFKQDRKGNLKYYSWDIAGMPAADLAVLSKRSKEIEDLEQQIIAERKAEDPYAPDELSAVERDKLGATSRRTKRDDLTLEECREYWQTLFSSDGAAQIDELIRRARLGVNPKPEHQAAAAVDFAMRHHFEKESAVPVQRLVATALERSMGSARPEDIERELKRRGVILVEKDGRQLATTPELMREEQSLAGFAAAALGAAQAIGVAEGLTRKLPTGETLSDGQWDAAIGLLSTENRVSLVLGPAGAGKSKLLKKFEEGAKLAGTQVTYLGTTSTSVGVLREDGFDAHTLASFLLSDKMQQAARGGRIVLDETSILGHADAVKLFAVARQKDLTISFIADPMQHGAVGRGNFVRLLTEYGDIKPFRLTQILRQKDPAYRAAAQLLSEGKAAEGFNALDKLGMVKEIEHGGQRYAAMAADYAGARSEGLKWNDLLMIAPTHREAGHITQEVRRKLHESGTLGSDERELIRLVPVDASAAERGLASTYRLGDVLQFHQNAKGGFTKGERLTVTDPAKLPLAEAEKFTLYRPQAISLSAGDVIRFTGTVHTLGKDRVLKNGAAHAVAGFTEAGHIRLDSGDVIARDAGHFRYGYVETSVGSQGRTVKRTILGMSAAAGRAAIHMQQMYVSATRSVESLRIYTDAKDEVRSDIRKDSRKLLALDLKPAWREAQRQERRQQVERNRRRSFLKRLRAEWERLRARPRRALARSLPQPAAIHAERVMRRRHFNEHDHER